MSKRKDSQQIRHFLRDVDRELTKGLTLGDVCRKHGVGVRTYYRWRERYDPTVADDTRRAEELQAEVDRLKRLVAELMLDRQMLQDVAKKSGDGDAATCGGRVPGGGLWDIATKD